MPRVPRNLSAQGAMRPGTVYHVTSHAVARTPLYETPRDYLIFLSQLAEQCRSRDLLVHAFCLMTTHFHLQIEDRRGQISQAMAVLKSLYARYYNSTREGGPRRGALWSTRFHSSVIATRRYFDASAAYIHLNPIRTKTRMTESPEGYPWSSCAMTAVDGVTPTQHFRCLIERAGGVDAILDSMPKSSTRVSNENRRRRFEILLLGREFSTEGVLGNRSRLEYLAHLQSKSGTAKTEMLDARIVDEQAAMRNAPARIAPVSADTYRSSSASLLKQTDQSSPRTSRLTCDAIPLMLATFTGLTSKSAVERIRMAVSDWIPDGERRRRESRDLEIWALWRFTSFSARRLASLVGTSGAEVERALRRVRVRRVNERAWWRSIWNAEWSLYWSLAAAPWRD